MAAMDSRGVLRRVIMAVGDRELLQGSFLKLAANYMLAAEVPEIIKAELDMAQEAKAAAVMEQDPSKMIQVATIHLPNLVLPIQVEAVAVR